MDKDFIESLRGLSEGEIEKKLKELGYKKGSAEFNMASQPVTRAVLPRGSESHKEVLFLDYNVIRPEQYDPHQCYAIFFKK